MALWDPEAAGNAAKYLRLDDITLIDIRNAPFEGRTACWIPYAETGYTKVMFYSRFGLNSAFFSDLVVFDQTFLHFLQHIF